MFGFSDETYLDVSSGNGGAGCVSFHREKFVPRGGPDGGDGGKGGDVVFVVKDNLRTLGHLKAVRAYKAENGRPGQGDRCFGRNGRDVEIPVPPGTVLRDAGTGKIIKDLTGLERFVFLKGGKGGLGNWHFRTSVRQAPRYAQPGEKGISMRVGVELQIIADIGFVGFPNAGKSSLLNMLTNARSKVAGYPFTTKIPQLGVMRYDDRDVVLADIPGILEGASTGLGMGIKFLKHISRTNGLAYLIDVSDERFIDAFDILKNELSEFSSSLAEKKSIIIVTKMDDAEDAEERFLKIKEKYPEIPCLPLSIYMDELLEPVKRAFMRLAEHDDEKASADGFTTRVNKDAEYRDEA